MSEPAPPHSSARTDRSQSPSAAILATALSLPKVVLHDHLDGSLRPATLLELLHQRGLQAPAADVPALQAWFDARAHAGSLVEYLRGFALTVAAMATPEALARVAFEAVVDAHADGCVLAEFRIAPLLFEAFSVPGEAAVEALLAGLRRGQASLAAPQALPCGLIVCAMRHEPPERVARAAELALRYQSEGVLAFDLAGAEAGHPASEHAELLRRLTEQGLPLTLHAGEADVGMRVVEAARLGARRVGHGVRFADLLGAPDGQALQSELAASGLHFEVCPTSNVHTGAAASLASHPIRALWEAGLSLSFHPDNRLISGVSMSSEAAALHQVLGFGWDELRRMGLAAADASFLPEAAKAQARAALVDWQAPAVA